MKNTLSVLIISLVLFGCSSKNAFDHFSLTEKQESYENSIQSSKIYKDEITDGVVNVVYLNKVYPKLYQHAEYFYIYLYTKDEASQLSFELNCVDPLMVEELNSTNEFTHLSLSHADWQRHYIVGFKEQDDMLKMFVKNGQFSSDAIIFEKDE